MLSFWHCVRFALYRLKVKEMISIRMQTGPSTLVLCHSRTEIVICDVAAERSLRTSVSVPLNLNNMPQHLKICFQ